LLTALTSYLDARAQQGEWLVRIDDLDGGRTRPGASDTILATLDALGLHWDRDILYQSQRTSRYAEFLEQLWKQERLYACTCSRRLLAEAPPLADGACPSRCRDHQISFEPGTTALRIRVPEVPVHFEDRIKGELTVQLQHESGDFALFRRDGVHAYHLATVIDDHDSGITDVVRGEDLLDSTPQQIFLQECLNLKTPRYAHTPLMVSPDGRKLSKSKGAPPIDHQKAGRVMATLLQYLGINLPETLQGASAQDLLEWAIPHWDVLQIRQIGTLIVEDNQIPE
jgi:glutamyl-Q tRNA(Asp) synthetase